MIPRTPSLDGEGVSCAFFFAGRKMVLLSNEYTQQQQLHGSYMLIHFISITQKRLHS